MVVLGEATFAIGARFAGIESVSAGTLSNSTNLGIVFILLMPWAFSEVLEFDDPVARLKIVTALLAVAALAITESRVAFLVVLAWLAWALLTRVRYTGRIQLWVGLSLLVAVVFALVMMATGPSSIFDRAALGERPQMYAQAVRAVQARPFLGWGMDGFLSGGASSSTFSVVESGNSLTFGFGRSDPHNILLALAVSSGIPGVLLFVWAAVSSSIIVVRARRPGSVAPHLLWALVGAAVILLTTPLVVHVGPLLAVMLGMGAEGVVGLQESSAEDPRRRLIRHSLLIALGVAAFTLALNSLSRAPLEVANQDRSPRLAATALRVAALWPADAHLAYLSSLHSGWAGQADPLGGWQERDLAALDRAVRMDRRNPVYALERALAIQHYGGAPGAIEAAYAEAFERYPAYPPARAEYALYLAQTGRIDEARAQLDAIAGITDADPARIAAVEAAEAAIAAAGE